VTPLPVYWRAWPVALLRSRWCEELGEERLLGADILQGKLYLGEHWLRGRLHAETADRAIEIVRRVGTPSELGAILGAAIIGYLGNNRFDDIEAIWNEALEITVKHGDFGNEMRRPTTARFEPIQVSKRPGEDAATCTGVPTGCRSAASPAPSR
jgi:hypothetical protein